MSYLTADNVLLGTVGADRVYCGSELVWEKKNPYESQCLTYTFRDDVRQPDALYFKIGTRSSATTSSIPFDIEYKINNGSWEKIYNRNNITVEAGDKVSFRGTNNGINDESQMVTNVLYFNGYGNLSGNIMSILDGGACTLKTISSSYCFQYLFYGDRFLQDASNLVLPATSLAGGCYYNMFKGCTGLTTPPKVLPATTLATSCYNSMFYECTVLTKTPEIRGLVLGNSSYKNMFYNCKSLKTVTIYATNISATDALTTWLSYVSSSGDFYCKNGVNYPSGASGIPSGWTKHIMY